MLIGLKYRGKKIKINVKSCNCFEKFLGLMFARREKAKALLFKFDKNIRVSIHSFFVFFEFIAVWLDDKGKIIEIRKIKPFSFCIRPKESFNRLVEIPMNMRYRRIIKLLVSN